MSRLAGVYANQWFCGSNALIVFPLPYIIDAMSNNKTWLPWIDIPSLLVFWVAQTVGH